MSSKIDWTALETYFHELADATPAQCRKRLEQIAIDQPGVAAALRQLLESDKQTHPIFTLSREEVVNDLMQEQELLGTRVGPFELQSVVGQGAMGTVFRAVRVDGQFNQTVAVKLLRGLITSNDSRSHFSKEQEIFARLNHPQIARLYDGGFTASGRPYMVMEFISGSTITEYSESKKLSWEQRLDLFLQVCQAVRYAHQSLIAHLDLKPQNIIVTGDGQVKLLDFGVARILSESDDRSKKYTPAYAAPEQIKGEDTDSRTDIYSLGIILFELITGEHPFKSHFNDLNALTDAIVHGGLPPFPGTMPSDLHHICSVMTSLDPTRRYSSVDQIIRDIQAYRNDFPVSIRERRFGYVAGKYIRRNRQVLTSLVAALLIVGALLVYYTLQLRDQRNIARSEAKKSEQISGLLTDVFLAADPNEGNGDTLTALQLLDNGLVNLQRNLESDPLLLATMYHQISPIYMHLGQYETGMELARKSLALRQTHLSYPHADLAGSDVLLGQAYYYLGQLDSSIFFIQQGIAQLTELGLQGQPQMADALFELANNYYDKGEYLAADSIYSIVYAIHRSFYQPPDINLASDLHMMGATQRKLTHYDRALVLMDSSLQMKRQLFKEPHLEIAYTLNHIGSLHQNMGDFAGSIPFIRESLKQRLAIVGDRHMESVASMSNLARAFSHEHMFDSASYYYKKALTAAREIFGESHYYVPAITGSLGGAYLEGGRFEEAKEQYLKAVELNRTLLPEGDLRQSVALFGLGQTCMALKEFEEARENLQKAYDIRKAILPADHQQVAQSQKALGECYLALGNYSAAISYLDSAAQIYKNDRDQYASELTSIESSLTSANKAADQAVQLEVYSK